MVIIYWIIYMIGFGTGVLSLEFSDRTYLIGFVLGCTCGAILVLLGIPIGKELVSKEKTDA